MLAPPCGHYVLAAGTAGEAYPLVALSLILAGMDGFGARSIILVAFAPVAAVFIAFAGRIRTLRLAPVLRDTITSSGQFPIRLALFLAFSLALRGECVGLDLVRGAFVSGAVLRALVPDNLHHDLMTRLAVAGVWLPDPDFGMVHRI